MAARERSTRSSSLGGHPARGARSGTAHGYRPGAVRDRHIRSRDDRDRRDGARLGPRAPVGGTAEPSEDHDPRNGRADPHGARPPSEPGDRLHRRQRDERRRGRRRAIALGTIPGRRRRSRGAGRDGPPRPRAHRSASPRRTRRQRRVVRRRERCGQPALRSDRGVGGLRAAEGRHARRRQAARPGARAPRGGGAPRSRGRPAGRAGRGRCRWPGVRPDGVPRGARPTGCRRGDGLGRVAWNGWQTRRSRHHREGKLDAQSMHGKTIAGVLRAAEEASVRGARSCGVVEIRPPGSRSAPRRAVRGGRRAARNPTCSLETRTRSSPPTPRPSHDERGDRSLHQAARALGIEPDVRPRREPRPPPTRPARSAARSARS